MASLRPPVEKHRDFRMSQDELAKLPRPDEQNSSQIGEFYRGRSVLVTGASGFIGKLLVEKLLRACNGIKRIYVIVRPKRNMSPAQRMDELMEYIIFDGVRGDRNKVVALAGDISRPYLGLNQADLDRVVDEVSVVFHSAAMVGFMDPLKRALLTNLGGTNSAIQVCRKLKRLAAMVYVSTAYSNCTREHIEEHLYPVNIDPGALLNLAQVSHGQLLDELSPALLGKHPNTYTYSKSLAEWLCGQHSHELPMVICRPSVVVASKLEPVSGYIDNINGTNGVYALSGRGWLRSLQCKYDHIVIDQIPADTVVSSIIALGWFADLYHRKIKHRKSSPSLIRVGATRPESSGEREEEDEEEEAEEERRHLRELEEFHGNVVKKLEAKQLPEELADLPVFNITSSDKKPIPLNTFADRMCSLLEQFPSEQLLRCPRLRFVKNQWAGWIHRLFAHTLVAYLLDMWTWIATGKSGPMVQIFAKLDMLVRVWSFFLSRRFRFAADNRHRLVERFMSAQDRYLFDCDLAGLDWAHFMRDYALGIRKYIFCEPKESLERSVARLRMVYWRNTLAQLLLVSSFLHLTVRALALLWS